MAAGCMLLVVACVDMATGGWAAADCWMQLLTPSWWAEWQLVAAGCWLLHILLLMAAWRLLLATDCPMEPAAGHEAAGCWHPDDSCS